jgi:hypothetical protein
MDGAAVSQNEASRLFTESWVSGCVIGIDQEIYLALVGLWRNWIAREFPKL